MYSQDVLEVNVKAKFGACPYVYPVPIVLAGANVAGRPNFVTLGACGVMGINPPLVYISSNIKHYTNRGILENHTFSVNFPTTDMLAVTDYCGVVSGSEVDKSQLFDVFYGDLETAPMISECPVNLECRVEKEFTIEHRQVFVGRIAETYVNEEYIIERDGYKTLVDLTILDPIAYALDNLYYRIGEPIGEGYQEARELSEGRSQP